MNSKVIVIDGKTYNSVEEMPPEVRQKYEQGMSSLANASGNSIPDALENIFTDKDKNGVPDIVENLVAGQAAVTSMKIIVNGKEFDGIENLPPEARAKYEAAMSKLDTNQNGIPDFVEGLLKNATPTVTTSNTDIEKPTLSQPLPVSPTIAPDTSNGLMLALAGLFIFLLCVGAGGAVWYFFLR